MADNQELNPGPTGSSPNSIKFGPIGKILIGVSAVGAVIAGAASLIEHHNSYEAGVPLNDYYYEKAHPRTHYVDPPGSITTPEQASVATGQIKDYNHYAGIADEVLAISLAVGTVVAGAEFVITKVTHRGP